MKRRVNKVCLFSTEELDEFRAALYNVNTSLFTAVMQLR